MKRRPRHLKRRPRIQPRAAGTRRPAPRAHAARALALALGAALAGPGAAPALAQSTLERTPNLDGAWVGAAGFAYVTPVTRFFDADASGGYDLAAAPTYDLSLALPRSLLAGVRLATESAVARPGRDEWEPYLRWTPLREGPGALPQVGATIAWNGGSESVDGALSVARWLGPLRLLAEARVFGDPVWSGGVEAALGGGVVLHVLAGRMPVALAGDWSTPFDRPDGMRPVWSGGLQVGIPFTQHTLSLHATNATTTTIAGRSVGGSATRYGVELTIPLGVGSLFGMNAPRELATRAVVEDSTGTVAVHAFIARYAFLPQVVEVRAGDVVEWTNDDGVMHTVNAEDGAWHSGAIQPGASWRAGFDAPGRYPFYCGPHPFMKGIVVVRPR